MGKKPLLLQIKVRSPRMYVCPEATGHSFWAKDMKFGTHHPLKTKEKINFFCEFQIFKGHFSTFYPKKRWKVTKKAT